MKETKKFIDLNNLLKTRNKLYIALALLLCASIFFLKPIFLPLFIIISTSTLGIVYLYDLLADSNSRVDVEDDRIEIDKQSYQNQKMQSIGQLAGGVAHDFNNVLTAIIVSTDLLILRFKPEDPTFRELHEIRDNAQRAAGIVRQLLAYSRQQNFNLEIISLTDILQEQITLLNRLVGDKITIEIDHESDLWLIKGDLNQFESVITNLVINARDAIESKKTDGKITISTSNISEMEIPKDLNNQMIEKDYVKITIKDNGIGIPEDLRDKIFEPFYSSKGHNGTGLGLSMVYGIIKQLNGYIFVSDNMPESGTRFDIYIPRYFEDYVLDPIPIINQDESLKKDITGDGRILLVEDEDSVRMFTKKALELSGYEVAEAYDGVSGLNLIKNGNIGYDLIITDVMMPEMDGPTLVNEVKKILPDQKILFISGYTENNQDLNVEKQKEVYFLNKPFTLEELNLTVKKIIFD